MPQKGELLSEHLLEGPVGRKQAVAHEDGLLAVLDHVPIEAPVVVRLLLLAAGGSRKEKRKREEKGDEMFHEVPPSSFHCRLGDYSARRGTRQGR